MLHLLAQHRLQLVAQLRGLLILSLRNRCLQLLRHIALGALRFAALTAAGRQPYACRALVQEVDRLVRQEPVGQIPARELHRSVDGPVGDADAVVALKPRPQPQQNLPRLLAAGLFHLHRTETPLQRRVLFDILSVLCQRRRADHLQLSPAERRLEQICRVDGALCAAGAYNGVHFIDK